MNIFEVTKYDYELDIFFDTKGTKLWVPLGFINEYAGQSVKFFPTRESIINFLKANINHEVENCPCSIHRILAEMEMEMEKN